MTLIKTLTLSLGSKEDFMFNLTITGLTRQAVTNTNSVFCHSISTKGKEIWFKISACLMNQVNQKSDIKEKLDLQMTFKVNVKIKCKVTSR